MGYNGVMSDSQHTDLLPAYLAVGEDALKREAVIARLKARLGTMGNMAFNSDEFDGEVAEGAAIAAACNTMPFASPVRLVYVRNVDKLKKADAEELVNYGYVRGKVMLGITYVDIEDAYTAMRYRVNDLGLYIVSSEYTDDLKAGDRIVAIDDTQITYSSDIKSILKKYSVGDEITVKVVRDGQYIDVKVTLHEYVPSTTAEDTTDSSAN